jgi:hypothetical protein
VDLLLPSAPKHPDAQVARIIMGVASRPPAISGGGIIELQALDIVLGWCSEECLAALDGLDPIVESLLQALQNYCTRPPPLESVVRLVVSWRAPCTARVHDPHPARIRVLTSMHRC